MNEAIQAWDNWAADKTREDIDAFKRKIAASYEGLSEEELAEFPYLWDQRDAYLKLIDVVAERRGV